jgi:hypothetical protein
MAAATGRARDSGWRTTTTSSGEQYSGMIAPRFGLRAARPRAAPRRLALPTYKNTNPDAFARFMSDRAAVERFRSQAELYVGRVQGADPADPDNTLGRTPGRF